MATLDLEAVQAFVLVADLKSFTRAAEALGATQSAISLRIKRLETDLGRRLFDRTPRLVRLSAAGEGFLGPARALVAAHGQALASVEPRRRRLVVGLSHHVVGPELPMLLRRVSEADPATILELQVDPSRSLIDRFEAGELDAAVVFDHEVGRRDGWPVVMEGFGWFGAVDFQPRPGEPVRLAAQAAGCGVRCMATSALDRAGVAWTEVFVGGGSATLGAAAAAGLALAALGRRVAPAGTIDWGPRLGLPALPDRMITLLSHGPSPARDPTLGAMIAAIRSGRIAG